jgi:hypothetical protein
MYDVYLKDDRKRQTETRAILAERRNDPFRQNGLKWQGGCLGKWLGMFTVFSFCPGRWR